MNLMQHIFNQKIQPKDELREVQIYHVNHELVGHLKMLLRDAESGELRSGIYVMEYVGDRVTSGFSFGKYANVTIMLGEYVLKQQVLIDWIRKHFPNLTGENAQ